MIDVDRPATAPESLAERRRYNADDVLAALHLTFLGKCYLCETPVEIGTFEVDHRRPKAQFERHTYAWENLFPACNTYRCNNRRPRKYPDGGLLDPGQGVETRVEQRIEGAPSISLRSGGSTELVFCPRDPLDLPARNTAIELDRIHNAPAGAAINSAKALRMKVLSHVLAVRDAVSAYLQRAADPTVSPVELDKHERYIRRLVSRRAPYSALVRSCVSHPDIRKLFD